MNKKILIVGGVVGAILLYTAKKAADVATIVKQLQISVSSLKSIPKLYGLQLRAIVDISLQNPTVLPLDISTGGAVSLDRIHVYNSKQELLGSAEINLENIEVPANGTYIIKDVPITTELKSLVNYIFTNGFTYNENDLVVYAEFTALGKSFTV